ncbi:DUF4064 domain-containing protein [Sporosarcina sp. PTS2304]|uniref:DUF4064 domain-containing protein n=1 Tax=Sporosarcina sp. PTS2304 TaxID=2283194 RepID=UPI000E0D23F2|nr:DUF4064 domain-containing protein [Sporosarcina sp. PTS2304]AXI00309.1 DUF4064 domain-containing protein [Sporosarcina sp. PTS2304]
MINRTAEKILSIIAAIFTFFGMAMLIVFGFFLNMAGNDPNTMEQFREVMLADGTLSVSELDMFMEFFDVFAMFIWVGVAVALIGLVLNIIGLVKLRTNAKAAGTLFIIAGLFNGILSLTSILLYIAGILCFTKKPPMAPEVAQDEYVANQSNWMN